VTDRGIGRVRVAVAAGVLAVLGLGGLAGCTGSGGTSSVGSSPSAEATRASVVKGLFSAGQLRNALLSRINGVAPVAAPDAGSYTSLPEIQAAVAHMARTTIAPKECAQATVLQVADLDTGALGRAPAAVVNFRLGGNGVSEVLAATAGSPTAAALGKPVPASCAHYRTTAAGHTFQYAVYQDLVRGIGKQPARVLNISSPKQGSNVWSVLYRGDGFVGAITVTGPNASEAAVRDLGQQAYAYAAGSLGG
jgi:hypothetical protein